MITFIHGEDIVKSRDYLFFEKKKWKNFLNFEGEKVSETELLQALEGSGLFGEKMAVFLENLFTRKQNSEKLKKIIAILNIHKDPAIYLWEAKEITAKEYLQIKEINIKHFPLPKIIFTFLDNFKPNNSQQLIKLFNQTLNEAAIKQVMFMLIRQIRLLLALSDNELRIKNKELGNEKNNDIIDEVKRLSVWQKNKLLAQTKLFSIYKKKQIHENLFEIDLAAKTGNLSMPLRDTIDFFLMHI